MSELALTPEIVNPPHRTLAPSGGGAKPLQGIVQSARGLAAQPAVAKSLPMLGLLAVLAIAAAIWMAFSTAPQKDLFKGLPDEDKAAVAEALKSSGIAYSLDRDTGALAVSEDDYHQARMLLASQGLPKSAPDGGAIIDALPLGASRAVEAERLRSSREVDLARTIEAIDAVQTARIHLAVETPSVFLRDRSKPAASVMLRLVPGRTLGDAQVQAIIHLVASSVPGLAPEGVSVVDQNGRLLSSENDNGLAAESERQVSVQAKIEERYRQSLVQLLTPILGEGNFTTEVHADVDFNETQATREGFPKEATALRAEEGSFSTEGGPGGGEAGGIPGALSNTPPPAAEVAAAPEGAMNAPIPGAPGADAPGLKNQNYVRSFAVGREVSVTKQQVGTVKRLSVAVALKNPEGGKPRSKEEIAALEALVKGAVGFDQARGDVVALSARAFAPEEVAEPNWWEAGWVAMLARNLTALAVAALIVFGIAKPMLKRSSAARAERAKAAEANKAIVGGEIAAAIAEQQSQDPGTKVTLGMIESAPSYEARAALIRNFVRQDPARAALVVRDLIRADEPEAAVRG
jgi:flagellar M-ring protein FliF